MELLNFLFFYVQLYYFCSLNWHIETVFTRLMGIKGTSIHMCQIDATIADLNVTKHDQFSVGSGWVATLVRRQKKLKFLTTIKDARAYDSILKFSMNQLKLEYKVSQLFVPSMAHSTVPTLKIMFGSLTSLRLSIGRVGQGILWDGYVLRIGRLMRECLQI